MGNNDLVFLLYRSIRRRSKPTHCILTMPFTTDDQLELIFDAKLIPDAVRKALPEDLHVRPLASNDYDRGHLKVLAVLTKAPDVGSTAWKSRFDLMRNVQPAHYYPIVIISKQTDQIAAVGTLFVEYKFIRGNARTGHIEDIAVDSSAQGKGLGKRVIQCLTAVSESLGCYKTFLDCSEDNKGFYEKCEYKYAGVQMSKYAPS
ncbi:unnamed protein product [Jaminaea pallidilutea]